MFVNSFEVLGLKIGLVVELFIAVCQSSGYWQDKSSIDFIT